MRAIWSLTSLKAPNLTTMKQGCLSEAKKLKSFEAPNLTTMERWCLTNAPVLKDFVAPKREDVPAKPKPARKRASKKKLRRRRAP